MARLSSITRGFGGGRFADGIISGAAAFSSVSGILFKIQYGTNHMRISSCLVDFVLALFDENSSCFSSSDEVDSLLTPRRVCSANNITASSRIKQQNF